MTYDDFVLSDDGDRPLIPERCGDPNESFLFDESGTLTMATLGPNAGIAPSVLPGFAPKKPCSLSALDGSWNLSFRPKNGRVFAGNLRGPMRIEANADLMRVSGDMYFQSWLTQSALGGTIERSQADDDNKPTLLLPWWRRNWYPHYPFDEYRWYFRSTGVSYSDGEVFIPFTRHLWNGSSQEFTSTDSGWVRLRCEQSVVVNTAWLQPTLRISGEAMIGGMLHTATATKTSPYYRGSVVEVDVMENRTWPTSAAGRTFASIYRTAGIDISVRISDVDVPEDATLSTSELHTLLTSSRDIPDIGNSWHMWLFVGSRRVGSNTFGLMFDQQEPHREGAVGYYDATLGNSAALDPSVRNQNLGDVPAAFMRTLVHEAGHAFNLFHPKSDVHDPDIGETVMNQTGDVMGFATAGNLYPNNIDWFFNEHNRTSLIHSPDPQIAPGWKEFGWGHGSAFGGVPEPADALGLRPSGAGLSGLDLTMQLPDKLTRGEFVTAEVTLANNSSGMRRVNRALNLAEGDLEITMSRPSGQVISLRDVVHLCGPSDTVDLQPGENITAHVQLFYANCGHVFDEPGRYKLRARMTADAATATIVEADEQEVIVEIPSTRANERRAELMMDEAVGLSFALGDFGPNDDACNKLKKVANNESGSDSGTAAALVLANSYSKSYRDPRTGDILRRANSSEVTKAMSKASDADDSVRMAALATVVASPGEIDAPVFDEVTKRVAAVKAKAKQPEKKKAMEILDGYGTSA